MLHSCALQETGRTHSRWPVALTGARRGDGPSRSNWCCRRSSAFRTAASRNDALPRRPSICWVQVELLASSPCPVRGARCRRRPSRILSRRRDLSPTERDEGHCATTGRAVEDERPTQDLHPVAQPDEAGPPCEAPVRQGDDAAGDGRLNPPVVEQTVRVGDHPTGSSDDGESAPRRGESLQGGDAVAGLAHLCLDPQLRLDGAGGRQDCCDAARVGAGPGALSGR